MIRFELKTKDGVVRQVIAEKLVMTEEELHFESGGSLVGEKFQMIDVVDCYSLGEV